MARERRRLSNKLSNRKSVVTAPRHTIKVERNEPCPCGSGKKYKSCHYAEGEAYLAKLAREADEQLLKEKRAELKAQGVPWYKRIFVR